MLFKMHRINDCADSDICLSNTEIAVEELESGTELSDLVYGYNKETITGKPIKRIFIGNGKSLRLLHPIIVLDNSDFIITDPDKNIISYINNGIHLISAMSADM